jgi:hypothetical protein
MWAQFAEQFWENELILRIRLHSCGGLHINHTEAKLSLQWIGAQKAQQIELSFRSHGRTSCLPALFLLSKMICLPRPARKQQKHFPRH